MRGFFYYLTRVLVLIVVFMLSALTAMRFAIHGRQTTISENRWHDFEPGRSRARRSWAGAGAG